MNLIDSWAHPETQDITEEVSYQVVDKTQKSTQKRESAAAAKQLDLLLNTPVMVEFATHKKYSMAFSQKLRREEGSLCTEVLFLANNVPVCITHRQMRRLLYRYLNHCNTGGLPGCFLVDPLTGVLRFRTISMVLNQGNGDIADFVLQTPAHLQQPLEATFLKILERCGLLNGQSDIQREQQGAKKSKLTTIQKCVEISTIPFPVDAVRNSRTSFGATIQDGMQQLIDPRLREEAESIRSFQKYFLQVAVSTSLNPEEPNNVLNNITIKNAEEVDWQPIKLTNFSKIERGRVTFTYKTNIMKEFTKLLVRKTDAEAQGYRVKREHQMLECLRQSSSPNFVRHFTDGNKTSLYTELSTAGTFKSYLKQNYMCVSLLTKLYSLAQILQGMRFLHQNKVTHMDLKPQNVLIGRNLNMKLTDLGEAHHPQRSLDNYQPGTSIPYSSPQAYQYGTFTGQCITNKSDVYSFGVMLMESLFSTQPLEVSNQSMDKLYEDFASGKYHNRLIVNPMTGSECGPQPIMEILYALAIRCFDPNPNNRPEVKWMTVVLRESLAYLQRIY